jgi:purine-binding chemotaxis protein CheW
MAELAGTAVREGKYLTFTLGAEEYGIGIRKVKEIIGIMPVTPIPQTPPYLKGVINLRGKVIPVVSLRLKFGMDEADYTDRACIVVVEVRTNTDTMQVGIVVDTVSEVMNMREADIEQTPSFGASVSTDYILGMAKTDNGVKILLDIDKVINAEEIEVVREAA